MTGPVTDPAWRGPHGKGAMKARREEKRAEAEYRNARTPPERRRENRRLAGGGA